ncbi:MAG: hypothetical protein LAP86_15250 [Acidobacteriia bacterium]|nr:hypothetical protein [Terriglobia bacterium]
MPDFCVPFDDNLTQRAIGIMKLPQKISSQPSFVFLAVLISPMQKHGIHRAFRLTSCFLAFSSFQALLATESSLCSPLVCWQKWLNHLDKILKTLPWLEGVGRRLIALLGFIFVVDLLDFATIDP